MQDADEPAVVETGQPLRAHGTGILEHGAHRLSFDCDGTIAGQIWGAGYALGEMLLRDGLPERPEVVEVGSGTGIAGLAAAAAGASRVVLTDLPGGVPLLNATIQRNAEGVEGAAVLAASLEWGDDAAAAAACGPSGCDLVLAADVLYSGEACVHAALRSTLVALAAPRDARILHAYEERWADVVALWRSGLESPGAWLRVESRIELDAPPAIKGRSLILEELRVTEEGFSREEAEEAEASAASLLEASRRARTARGF